MSRTARGRPPWCCWRWTATASRGSDIVPGDVDVDRGGAALLAGEIDAWAAPTRAWPKWRRRRRCGPSSTPTDCSATRRWVVGREFAETRRPELEAVIAALQESDAWIVANPREAARFFVEDAERRGGTADLDRWEQALRGRPFGIGAVTDEFLDEQQRAADLLHANGLLPRAVPCARRGAAVDRGGRRGEPSGDGLRGGESGGCPAAPTATLGSERLLRLRRW